LDAKTSANKETTIFCQADKRVDYESIMSVMESLRKAGYLKVGVVGAETAAAK
ncbi:biopolymer transporter ExbD, partial [Pectobacterium brasiliense]|uniref:biopolymer transporter ExbD n=1 Tax=Pectobacterium brasiliense TaxID=180957 RepID=UPI001968C60B